MPPPMLASLLNLPAPERAALAAALWESLTPEQRGAEFALTLEQKKELDRRWQAHLDDPASSVSWNDFRRKLLDRE